MNPTRQQQSALFAVQKYHATEVAVLEERVRRREYAKLINHKIARIIKRKIARHRRFIDAITPFLLS